MKILLFTFCLFLSQIASAADVFDGSKPRLFQLADQLETDATIGGYPIWQGEKKWRLFDISVYSSSGSAVSVPMGTVSLFQTEEKKFIASMRVTANLAQGNATDWTDEPCKRDDLLFKASVGRAFSNVNCMTINHITPYPGNLVGRDTELFALFKEQGVSLPPTVIRIIFTRYTNNLRRLVVVLTINPELAGFPRDSETEWSHSSWHKSQFFSDPEKKRFVEALSVWASQFQKQMNAAFEKKSDAFAGVPSWRSVITAQPVVDSKKSEVTPKVTLD